MEPIILTIQEVGCFDNKTAHVKATDFAVNNRNSVTLFIPYEEARALRIGDRFKIEFMP